STYSETVLPARVVVMVLSPWQARHSAPGGSAARAGRCNNGSRKTVPTSVATIIATIVRPAHQFLRTTPVSAMSNSRAGFMNALQLRRHVPQGLKPAFFSALGGTAEAVPYPKPDS